MPFADSNSASAPLQELREQLASLATAAKSLREQRPSWLENILHPGRQARREADFGASVVAALKKTVLSIEEAQAGMNALERRLADLQVERLKSVQTDLNQLRERQEQLTREAARATQDWVDRAAEMQQQIESFAREQKEKIDQLAREQSGRIDQTRSEQNDQSEKVNRLVNEQSARIDRLLATQTDLGNELRERIQHVLDEQRVAIRQLSLKVSEDAILSDRARRAAELKMEELTQRIPPPPA
jgi:hypothetical protein